MSTRINALAFTSRIVHDGGPAKGKLFLGVLGLEYSIPFQNGGVQTFDVFSMGFASKPAADRLIYSYYNRTDVLEEWSYADGILPVYLRYEPDLVIPLNKAANGVESGPIYAGQWLDLDEPQVNISGKESIIDDTGAITYKDTEISFVVPVNPPSIRRVRLSIQDGTMLFLARIR